MLNRGFTAAGNLFICVGGINAASGPIRKSDTPSGYILGPGDQIIIHVVGVEELNDRPIPIDLNGSIRLPLVGRIPVAGLTVEQVGLEVARRLENYVIHPDVSVSVNEFRSRPVW